VKNKGKNGKNRIYKKITLQIHLAILKTILLAHKKPYKKMKITTIRLSEKEEKSLLQIASDIGATLRNGTPSWRKMIERIAEGYYLVSDIRDKKPTWERREKPEKKSKNGTPTWWRPMFDGAMGRDYALKKSGKILAEILELGCVEHHNPLCRLAPDLLVGPLSWRGKFKASPKHCPWWWSGNTMRVDDAVALSGRTLAELVDGGMRELNGELHPPSGFLCFYSDIAPMPAWWSPKTGTALMLLADAVRASKLDLPQLKALGVRLVRSADELFVTGPSGSEWGED
jgi:hypothetical protein